MKFSYKRNLWIIFILTVALVLRVSFELVIKVFRIDYSFTEFIILGFRYFTTFFAILIWIRIVAKSEYSISKLPWLLILAIEPFTGLALFLTFGRDFRESLRYRKHPLIVDGKYLTKEPETDFDLYEYRSIDSEITDIYKTAYNMTRHHAYINNSKAEVLRNGSTFFPRLMEELKKAEKFILMQFFIIRTDATGKQILNILKEKAASGVEVKIIYDALGSVFLNKRYMKSLRKAGVEIVANDPVYIGLFDTRVNYRNHRKTTVIDSKVAFIGGMNLANEYWNKSKRYPKFRDTQLLLEGKIINSLTSLFFRDWYYTTNDFIDEEKYYCAQKVTSEALIQIIPSGPDFKYPPIRNTYVKIINNAKKSIKIMTPYLALDREMITSLIIASRGGVDVEIIVPGKPDRKSVYEITRSFFQELLDEGVKIYTYKKMFTHAKVFICDDILASCGTYNLDNRSARINFEATALLYNTGVSELISDFDLDRSKSKLVDRVKWSKRNYIQRVFEGLIGLMAPLV